MVKPQFIPLTTYCQYPVDEMRQRAIAFCAEMRRRRSVRHFSNRPVPGDVIEECLRAAGAAPSGANGQPWHFVVIKDDAIKRQIRKAAEAAERKFYRRRGSAEWLKALEPLGTDEHKPFLEIAPYLIAIFVQRHKKLSNGSILKHYYAPESVGIATGILIAAIHHAGLVALPYTPSPMGFLNDILGRPAHEKPFLLLVVGYPADDAVVPDLRRKGLNEIATFL